MVRLVTQRNKRVKHVSGPPLRYIIAWMSAILTLVLAVPYHLPGMECGPPSPRIHGRLPYVSPQMETPEFWLKNVRDPRRSLMNLHEIQRMNEESQKIQDLYLVKVKDLKDKASKDELLGLLAEDWQGLGPTLETRYNREGRPLEESFWTQLRNNLHLESLQDENSISFALTVRRANLRVFPTEECSLSSPDDHDFDRFQHSAVVPGSLVGIYHFSRDKRWAYVQTHFIRGWVKTDALAVADRKEEAVDYDQAADRLVVTGSFVRVFTDTSLRIPAFCAQMGASFPILRWSEGTPLSFPHHIIRIPQRDSAGKLVLHQGLIPREEDVHRGLLPYTQENVALQAFKMLNEAYGWGEMNGGRDCSRFIMDIFGTFGIALPRNSKLQARVGQDLGQVEGRSVREIRQILDRAPPLATLLRIPGHIMLYLGKHEGRYYAIHSIWGIQKPNSSPSLVQKIARVVVSDLSIGGFGPQSSLLHRITDIRFLGKCPSLP